MADILCLKGDAAFSAFRLQRLQARLVAAVSDIESVVADYWHVVAQKRALNADERAKLATLLEEKAAGAEAGELFLVAPRIGTISPWLELRSGAGHRAHRARRRLPCGHQEQSRPDSR
ncbi:MAG: phosphoribosylformylglycinamidine synthase [Proteobacteria bacterium]|nr:phosphoribosylformylglycinamidine synthase [Pseudomonadota bacterium]